MPRIVFVYPVIRGDMIWNSLSSLRRYTKDYRVIVVDQSINGLGQEIIQNLYDHDDMYIRMRNAGFSKAANEGIVHALKWQVPYISVVNDDTVFMYEGWLDDLLTEFDAEGRIVCVSPESPRIAMWGYGRPHGDNLDIIPYKDEFTPEDIAYLKKGDYNKEEIQSRTPYEIPESFPFTKRGVVDAIAMWLPVFKREAFIELGLFEERFIWGGGEDYDMNARAYSCAYPKAKEFCDGPDDPQHKRMISSMKSWVWHWWGQSKDRAEELDPRLFEDKDPWNKLGDLWTPSFDVWGHWHDENGLKRPIKRTVSPLTSLESNKV